jgi:hypothetical protein
MRGRYRGSGPVRKGIPFSPDRPAPAGRLAGASGPIQRLEVLPSVRLPSRRQFRPTRRRRAIAARDVMRCCTGCRAVRIRCHRSSRRSSRPFLRQAGPRGEWQAEKPVLPPDRWRRRFPSARTDSVTTHLQISYSHRKHQRDINAVPRRCTHEKESFLSS